MTHVSAGEVRDKGPLLLLSQRFAAWLAAADVCLALTTYQAGRLFFIGRKPDGGCARTSASSSSARACGPTAQTLWTSGLSMLWRFEQRARRRRADHAAGRRPQASCRARGASPAAIDIHDIALGDDRRRAPRPMFVNTLFSCLATISDEASFRPLWRPPLHLRAGRPRTAAISTASPWTARAPPIVSAVSRSDVADGWRERRQRRRRRHRRGERRDRRERPVDAALAAALRRPAVAAQLRHRRVRHRRSGRAARSRRSRSAPAMRAGSPSPAATR